MRLATRNLWLLTIGLACSSPTAPSIEGSWGGAEASLSLTRAGGALSFLCASGTIDSTWTLTREGRFDATGRYRFEGGPVIRVPEPARYSGRVAGNHFSLTITLIGPGETLGPYDMIRGGPQVYGLCA